MSDSDVIQLLSRARDGDESAREELFAKCRSYVAVVARAHVEGRLRKKVDASDLVQQTLLEAHRGLKDFRGGTQEEWLAWLKGILTHNATDFVRRYCGTEKRQIQREVPLHDARSDHSGRLRNDPSDPGESPSQLILRHERELEVAEAIEQLPEDYRDVIMLRNLQRLPFNDVADRMGRSRGAVQMLWLRALRQLETILSTPRDD